MFSNPARDEGWTKARKTERDAQRQRVLWLTDQIVLATYHHRPEHEIKELLAHLRATTERKDN